MNLVNALHGSGPKLRGVAFTAIARVCFLCLGTVVASWPICSQAEESLPKLQLPEDNSPDDAETVQQLTGSERAQITAVAFSPDSRRLAAGLGNSFVTLWNSVSGKEERVLEQFSGAGPIKCVMFSADGKHLLMTNELSQSAFIVDVNTGASVHEEKCRSSIFTAAFSPIGSFVAISDGTRSITLLQLDKPAGQKVLGPFARDVNILAFSPDASRLAVCFGRDTPDSVQVFDCKTGKSLWESNKSVDSPFLAMAFVLGGKALAAVDRPGRVRLFDAATGEPFKAGKDGSSTIQSDQRDAEAVVALKGGERAAVCGPNEFTLVDLQDMKTLPTDPMASQTTLASGNGKIAIAQNNGFVATAFYQDVRIYSAVTHELMLKLPCGDRPADLLAISPDGTKAAVCWGDQVALVRFSLEERHQAKRDIAIAKKEAQERKEAEKRVVELARRVAEEAEESRRAAKVRLKDEQAASPAVPKLSTNNVAKPSVADTPDVMGGRGEMRENSVGMQFVFVPAGSFVMGLSAAEIGGGGSSDPTRVRISRPFWISTTEVTQGQWKRVMRTEPWQGKLETQNDPDCAVSYVSWQDAEQFCKALTDCEATGGALRRGERYSLPTEAQWEYACRAGSRTTYCCEAKELREYAWIDSSRSDANRHPQKVGTKKPNAWRLHDMHGNVGEWCMDWRTQRLPGGIDPVVTEKDPQEAAERMVRGGNWDDFSPYCASGCRGKSMAPDERTSQVGFRVILIPSETASGVASQKGEPGNPKGLNADKRPSAEHPVGKHARANVTRRSVPHLTEGEAERLLAAYDGRHIEIEADVVIDEEAAAVLATHNGHLYLEGVTALNEKAAEKLAWHRGWRLYLSGLKTLTPEVAAALKWHYGVLDLSGLRELPEDVAKEFSDNKNILVLQLNGLKRLSPSGAALLAKFDGSVLGLNGLEILPDEVADDLAHYKGNLGLAGVKKLSDKAADALSEHQGDLFLDGVTTLSEAAAQSLAQHSGELSLTGLTTLSDRAAAALKENEQVTLPEQFHEQ